MMPKESEEKEKTNNENTPPEESPEKVPREPSGQASQ
jgi:hypothetical protein